MLNMKDIMETITMIQEEHLDIRTITMGISLLDCCDTDIDKSCEKVYEKICRLAGNLVQTGEEIEKKYGIPEGQTLIMAAIESARGVMKALDICEASERLFGIALSGGDYTKDLQTHITGTGLELMGARQNMIIAARAAGVQCFDTVYTNLDDMEGFRHDVETIHLMGFDGKSIINPRQINIVHEIFTPTQKDIIFAEKVVKEIDEKKAQGIGVFTVDGKMIDIAFYDGAKRTIELAKASGVYKGDL